MVHRNRVTRALVVVLGLVLAALTLTPPATAGHQNDATFDTRTLTGSGPQSGTLSNGVGWSVDNGTAGPNQGYSIPAGQSMTYTFTQPVSLSFDITGLNCGGEAIRFQAGIEPVTIHPNHVWDGTTLTVTGNGANSADASSFESDAPVTSFTIAAIGAAGCFRGVGEFAVGYFDNLTPTATIAAPIDGGTFTQGQTVLADYSCADGDTVHVDEVTCTGDVPVGDHIDTAAPGPHSFTVTATDEHGATSSETVDYTVVPQTGACMAAAVNLPGNLLDLGVHNRPVTPCKAGSAGMFDFTGSLGLLPFPLTPLSPAVYVKTTKGVTGKSGSTFSATSTVAQVRISVPLNSYSFEIHDLWSQVEASVPTNCADGVELSSHVEFGRIVRNGTIVHNQGVNKTLSITVPLLGEIAFNRSIETADRVTTDAVVVDLPGNLLDVNIGRSVAGVDC